MIPSQLQPLANHLWQSTLFAAIAALLTLALRKNRARTRYWVWLAASVKFLIPFSLLVNVGSHWGRHAVPAITPPVLSYVIEQASQPFSIPAPLATTTAAPASSLVNWVPAVLSIVWVIGFTTLICSWWRRWRDLRAALRSASPLDLQIGMDAMMSPAFAEPGVFGLRRPVLLLPGGIMDRLTSPQLKAIVAHELCHIRRRDNLATAVHMGVEALFWFHPLVWWLGARLMEERERACDEEVLLAGSEPQAYAEGILKICELYLESPLPCVSGVTGANLRKRIEAIMLNRTGSRLSFAKKIILTLAAAAVLAAPIVVGITAVEATAQAQRNTPATQKPLTFEAASVKPSNPAAGPFGRTMGGPGTKDPGRIRYSNMSLKWLLVTAYGVNDFQIEGPGWMESGRFDIDATMPAESTKEQLREMLANLLVERFKIAMHRETKDAPAYALVVGKNGLKMAQALPGATSPDGEPPPAGSPQQFERDRDGFPKLPPGGPPGMLQFVVANRGRLQGRMQTMDDLTSRLAYLLGHPVANGTGLTGKYDFTLTFAKAGTSLDNATGPPLPPPPPGETTANVADTEVAPDLLSAVQSQLGLKLEAKKAPVEFIVIDRAERTPAPN